MTSGERFAAALDASGLHVSALAKKLGCSKRVVYKWKKIGPTVEVLEWIEGEAARFRALRPPEGAIARGRPAASHYVDLPPRRL